MAGEIEEPYRLNFQADSFHCGSISFGRFETEDLCWERNSSFSHNRYLEEVDKFSKLRSVTEKKAYFEAHFRKKGMQGQSSRVCPDETVYQTSENGFSEINDEIDHNHSEFLISEPQIETSFDDCDDVKCVSQQIEVEEDEGNHDDHEDLVSLKSVSAIGLNENFDGEVVDIDPSHLEEYRKVYPIHEEGSSPESVQEIVAKEDECSKPRLKPQVSVAQSRRYIPSKESKGSEKKTSKQVNNVRLRPTAEVATLEPAVQINCKVHKTSKTKPLLRTKGVCGIKSGEKESRNRTAAEQSANRVKPATVTTTKPGVKPDNSRFTLITDERAQRRKQFYMNLEEKMLAKEIERNQIHAKTQEKTEAELKELRKNLNFKAKPMPSFYHGTLRESNRNKLPEKATTSNFKPQNLRTKGSSTSRISSIAPEIGPSIGKIKTSKTRTDSSHVSETVSCHSTVTSDSIPSSPAAETNNNGINSVKNVKKEKDGKKQTNVRQHKGEGINVNQKTRTGKRTTYTAVKNGCAAVGSTS